MNDKNLLLHVYTVFVILVYWLTWISVVPELWGKKGGRALKAAKTALWTFLLLPVFSALAGIVVPLYGLWRLVELSSKKELHHEPVKTRTAEKPVEVSRERPSEENRENPRPH